ncbi:MAG TPA: competence/damage-inducible protein A [Gemmatimonadales bacterium]|jgi:nicotinamide-nucleotide amidase|nr:competence/damage-inducible protein A [Gemmatimonadales bacterium]
MNLEVVTIGTELLLGFTLDTNGAEIGRELAALGIRVVRRTSVADRPDEIRDAVESALRRSGAVLTTGGLGPTRDDITKRIVAELYGWPLDFDEGLWQALVERYRRRGRIPAESNRSQAEVPRGATVLPNQWGSAPGLWLEGPPGLTVMLPGVPLEMHHLLAEEVAPRLATRGGGSVIRSRTVRVTGIPESTLAERLGEIETAIAPLTLAYLPGLDGVDLRVTAWGLAAAEATRRLDAAAAELRVRAGDVVYGEDSDDLAALVLEVAREAGATIAVAESCTGGMLGARLTEIPGSSDVFVGGAVSYADHAKTALAGVPPALLAAHGAVSEPVAVAMAEGIRERLGADLAVAVTGIAGPGGGTADKPVGTVCFALSGGGETVSSRAILIGTRAEIRYRAAQAALFLLLKRLRLSFPGPEQGRTRK